MKTALGKGLKALIPEKISGEVAHIEIGRIAANRKQPRKTFNEESLKELSASIKQKGVIQPVVVMRSGDNFTLIAGERRWRAARLAGLQTLPVIIKDTTPSEALELALIENIQREDLSPIETANAYHMLIGELGLTQEALADRVGKERATVANYLRLLKLPAEIKSLINEGRLSMGHARALVSLEKRALQLKAAKQIENLGLSVRKTEALARKMLDGDGREEKTKPPVDPDLRRLEDKIRKNLGMKVKVKQKGKGGTLEIKYKSNEEFVRLLELLIT